jgi:hypothetical protein
MIPAITLGRLQVREREPELLWRGGSNMAVIDTGNLGFADASETDRRRWLNGFRRLLDGLDTRLQVAVEVEPGSQEGLERAPPAPLDFDEMRGADLWFADQIERQSTASRRSVAFVIDASQAARLESALTEIGVPFSRRPSSDQRLFGKQQPAAFLHEAGLAFPAPPRRLAFDARLACRASADRLDRQLPAASARGHAGHSHAARQIELQRSSSGRSDARGGRFAAPTGR